MAGDLNKPANSSVRTAFMQEIRDNQTELAKMSGSQANLPDGIIKYSSGSLRFEKYSTGAWTALDISGTTITNAHTVDTYHADATATQANKIPVRGGTGRILWGDKTAYRGAVVNRGATDMAIPHGVNTFINWLGESIDTDGIWTSGSQLIIPAGITKARLTAMIPWAMNNSGVRIAGFKLNGNNFIGSGSDSRTPATAAVTSQQIVTPMLAVAGGQYLQLEVYQNSGVSVDILANNGIWMELELFE